MISANTENEHGLTVTKRRTAETLLNDEGPYAGLLKELVTVAKDKGASDIHIDPNELGVALRLRVDGSLLPYKQIDHQHRESLILEAKRIFGLSIGLSGKPQDGRASLPSMRLDLRVSLLPTYYGEKIVMRLLNLDADFSLDHLGFTKKEQEMLHSALRLDDGVVIISGPTGSGKTRTLYALLKALGPQNLNIVTLEDPIEYRIEGLNQVQVTQKMSFADALRSVLRQDPDVILVGEIRDTETAKLCFQAAETGHLVFATLHANGALEVLERLSGLEIAPLVLHSNLRLSIAQRLEQRLCPFCSEPAVDSELTLVVSQDANLKTRRQMGCDNCSGGIKGRLPILEWAGFDKDEKGSARLFQSLAEARLQRAQEGLIDYKEIHTNEI